MKLLFAFLLLSACAPSDLLYPIESSEPLDASTLDVVALDAHVPIRTDASVFDAGSFIPPPPPPGDGVFHVQLNWNPSIPTDRTDVDLHLLHPDAKFWGAVPLDCFFGSRTPTWDGDREVSPTLDRDDVNGHGPENISMVKTSTTEYGRSYRVLIEFYSAHQQPGLAEVYVTIWCHQTVTEFGPLALREFAVWRVADVEFSSESCTIVPVGTTSNIGDLDYDSR